LGNFDINTLGNLQGIFDIHSFSKGDIFSFGQALFFGIGYWRLEHGSSKFPTESAWNTVGQLQAVAFGAVLFALLSVGLPSMDDLVLWLSNEFIVKALLWTGLVSTALALYLETVALKIVSASELTILMTSISLWSASFAYLTMGEVLSSSGMLGGFLILSGCLMSAVKPHSKTASVNVSTESNVFISANAIRKQAILDVDT